MHNVLLPRRRWGTPRVLHRSFWCLCLALYSPLTARAQQTDSAKGKGSAAKSSAAKSSPATADSKKEADKAATAPDVAAPANPADPSQTRKISPNEVFRDKKAEALVDLAKLKTAPAKPISQAELLDFNAQAGGANNNIDKELIGRVIDAMIAKLTDRANVQALVEPPENLSPSAPAFRGVQEATVALLEPIFQAKSVKNQAFLTQYYRLLREKLTPQLKNHLIPRVQAMIILGEAGIADYLPLYETQLKDPNQTVWVKLWALEGMVNVVEEGGRLRADEQIVAAQTVAEFLDKTDEVPWPVQLRAMEALSAMRQGAQPNHPQKALMANAAMTLLADGNARLEVRSEAAHALGMMQISSAVSKYNFQLVAHAAGQLAAELGSRIATGYTGNPEKARYWSALLIGPVYQAFDGTPGARDSGLLHAANGPSATYVQNVFDLVKPVVRSTIELLSAGQRQIKDKQKEVLSRVTALKAFLDQNAPADRHLVPDGAEFPIALLPDNGLKDPGPQTPGNRKNQ